MDNNFSDEYYAKKIMEIENKMEPWVNDTLLSAYGAGLGMLARNEFAWAFLGTTLLSLAGVDYYLYKRSDCYEKWEKGECVTEPIKLRKVIEYKKR